MPPEVKESVGLACGSAIGLAAALLALVASFAPASGAPSPNVAGSAVRLQIDAGAYAIQAPGVDWTFGGHAPIAVTRRTSGHDSLGAYDQAQFVWNAPQRLSGDIRVYPEAQSVLFTQTVDAPQARPAPFPFFRQIPDGIHILSFREAPFAPHAFDAQLNATPWIFFDDSGNACVLSPASHFLVARMWGDGTHEAGSGLNWQVQTLPQGFRQQTLMVFGKGVGATVRAWGRILTRLSGRSLPSPESEPLLADLGYWTDNGAAYYYRFDPQKGYAGSLLDACASLRDKSVPVRYLQVDSWWYPKGEAATKPKKGKAAAGAGYGWKGQGGIWTLTASPDIFPQGMQAFHDALKLPVIVHARWVDPNSPYRKQYEIAGTAPVDARYWDNAAETLFRDGVICYEQDWLSAIYRDSPQLASIPDLGERFTQGMADAMARRGLTVQYCMASPRFFLEASRLSDVTTIRASSDRFERSRWNDFLYAGMLARACGMWPWADVCRSSEADNLLVGALSAGPVGIGDAIGAQNADNVARVARADGVIVKPDDSLTPSDASIAADALKAHEPMVAWTSTDSGVRTVYVFAFSRRNDDDDFRFRPADFGLPGKVYVYDYFKGGGELAGGADAFTDTLGDGGRSYCIVAPVNPCGIALLGDLGKYVSAGRQRLVRLADHDGRLDVTAAFAAGETSVTLTGYAPSSPLATSVDGTCEPVAYDAATHLFSVAVHPAGDAATQARTATFSLALPPAPPPAARKANPPAASNK